MGDQAHPAKRGCPAGFEPVVRERERNRNIRSMRLGRRERYASSGHSTRSMVENAVFRYKAVFGRRVRRRSLGMQQIELDLASKILNTITRLEMPESLRAR